MSRVSCVLQGDPLNAICQIVRYSLMLSVVVLASAGIPANADTFGSGESAFEIEFVTIGAPGNPSEGFPSFLSPSGSVDYVYRMGKYEISTEMVMKANAQSAIDGAPLNIWHLGSEPNLPATSITWYEAAQFVNWLNTSAGAPPAYSFDENGEFQLWQPADAGYDSDNPYRNTGARYFLPNMDEWHKAAFYDPVAGVYYDYATGSDSLPDGIDFSGDPDFEAVYYDGGANDYPNPVDDVGLPSPFGTFGQAGNVKEWEESSYDLANDDAQWDDRVIRGSHWYGSYHGLAGDQSQSNRAIRGGE